MEFVTTHAPRASASLQIAVVKFAVWHPPAGWLNLIYSVDQRILFIQEQLQNHHTVQYIGIMEVMFFSPKYHLKTNLKFIF